MKEQRSKDAVIAAELYVDGLIPLETLRADRINATDAIDDAWAAIADADEGATSAAFAAEAAWGTIHIADADNDNWATQNDVADWVSRAARDAAHTPAAPTPDDVAPWAYTLGATPIRQQAWREWQAQNLIFNSFLPTELPPTYKTKDTIALAQATYYNDSAVYLYLVDALEELGCVLPLRQYTFYKGLYVVDWLLEKTPWMSGGSPSSSTVLRKANRHKLRGL